MKRTALLFVVASCVLLADLASLHGGPEGRWAHAASSSVTEKTPPRAARSSAGSAPTDSIRCRVPAGDVLITTLPERVAGRTVAAYDMLRTPALSNLAGRSFFWRTRPHDQGRHRLLFRARFDTTAAADRTAAPDTLAMIVTVTSD
jgi:hypothetical protein